MSKRDLQRAEEDRTFEEIRQAMAKLSDVELCQSLRDVPHRKWIEIEKDTHMAIGILVHRAAQRLEELTARAGMETLVAEELRRDRERMCAPETPVTLSPSEERSFAKVFEQSPRRVEETPADVVGALRDKVHDEYLRRNLLVAKAVGAKAGVSRSLRRLEQMSRPPKWLVESLRGVLERSDPLPEELAKWRDTASDAPEHARTGQRT